MTSASPMPNPTPNAELSGWLKLREAADAASRSTDLMNAAVRAAAASGADPVRVLDLGTGAGSNLR